MARRACAGRALFFDLQFTPSWRGVIGEGTPEAQYLEGACRIWNVVHYLPIEQWRHENRRKHHPLGLAQDIISASLAPALAATMMTVRASVSVLQ